MNAHCPRGHSHARPGTETGGSHPPPVLLAAPPRRAERRGRTARQMSRGTPNAAHFLRAPDVHPAERKEDVTQ
eukprot:34040-Pyramimonas_sp.AAC.1